MQIYNNLGMDVIEYTAGLQEKENLRVAYENLLTENNETIQLNLLKDFSTKKITELNDGIAVTTQQIEQLKIDEKKNTVTINNLENELNIAKSKTVTAVTTNETIRMLSKNTVAPTVTTDGTMKILSINTAVPTVTATIPGSNTAIIASTNVAEPVTVKKIGINPLYIIGGLFIMTFLFKKGKK